MEGSPKNFKKIHFSIGTFKKTKALSSVIQIKDEEKKEYESKLKRSSSYVIPKRFVPKIRPQKSLVNPPFFILNDDKNENKRYEKNNLDYIDNKETKSVKECQEDEISFTSSLDSDSETEEEKYSNQFKYLDKAFPKILSLNYIRRKLQQIKQDSGLLSIKECIDLSFKNLKNKFSLDDIFYNKNNNVKYNNYNEYQSSTINKRRPFLIFDVLSKVSKNNNNL